MLVGSEILRLVMNIVLMMKLSMSLSSSVCYYVVFRVYVMLLNSVVVVSV